MAILGLEEKEFFASGHRSCAGCGEALAIRHILKAAGEDTIIVMATGCMEVVSTPYPETAWELPWVHCAFENAAAVASGVKTALQTKGNTTTNVIAIGGDGAMFDIGFGSISGAVERGHKILYISTDNEAYQNTGIQRSGATFPFAATTTSPSGKVIPGKSQPKKPLPFIIAAHGAKYVATANVANLFDLKNKVQKALVTEGPSYISVFVPCIPGWKIDSSSTIDVSKMALETCAYPIYEIENGVLKLNHTPTEKKPIENYLKMQGRFKHITPEINAKIQQYVDERWKYLTESNGKKMFDTLF
ncbi:MAG: pyruvate synthase subunit beta [Candidatus Diapherotrites archaeon]|uniref:Pyruvate synthase subunit beta n=1 Tax=Candidatus Iainarchaeum sp. TaxID=3101447 RepID=A0A7K4BZE7_9ARCH|nr:pyruvate synthase subunit beta [Candidatus Diapherotrites archaeon]